MRMRHALRINIKLPQNIFMLTIESFRCEMQNYTGKPTYVDSNGSPGHDYEYPRIQVL